MIEDDLTSYLLDYAKMSGVNYELAHLAPDFSSRAVPEEDLIIINVDWYDQREIPFMIGHEIAHVLHHDKILEYFTEIARCTGEKDADRFSFDLIFDYNYSQPQPITDPLEFVRLYGIPKKMNRYAIKTFADCM